MNARSLKFLGLALLVLLSVADLSARAQSPLPHLDDPANLAGERVSAPDLADALPINHGAPALEQLLRKLRTRASFMLIVAHPDDEDGGMLTYLSRGQGARVAMLTLTRGEGGQNLMSGDFEDALGLIRTQELLAADRYMGVDQFFGTEVDFGFSKTKEEAFAKWTHERVLYDAVRAVRLYRPLVIASVFIGAPTDGHGHHQVAGEIAQEVFKAAGDPNMFPDQIAQGLEPWQPLKVYARIPFARIDAQGMFDYATNQYAAPRFENYVTGKVSDTVPKANVVVPEGTTDALLGGLGPASVSYVQFAREGLALQKTQIGGGARLARAGAFDVQYHRYGSRVLGADGKPQPDDGDGEGLESGFFAGIDTSLPGIASLAPHGTAAIALTLKANLGYIDSSIAEAQSMFQPEHSELAAPSLKKALQTLDSLIANLEKLNSGVLSDQERFSVLHELRVKRIQCNDAVLLALGVTASAHLASDQSASVDLVAGHSFNASFALTTGSEIPASIYTTPLTLTNVALELTSGNTSTDFGKPTPATEKDTPLKPGGKLELQFRAVSVPPAIPNTEPFFSRPDIEQPFYDIANPALRNAPATPSPLTVHVQFEYEGAPLTIVATVAQSTSSAPAQPAVVVPPVSVEFSRHAGVIPLTEKEPMVWVESTVPVSKCLSHTNDVLPPECNQFADEGNAHLVLPSGWHGSTSVETLEPHGTTVTQFDGFTLSPPSLRDGEKLTIPASTLWNGKEYREGFRAVGYPGIVSTNYYIPPAIYHATAVDLHLPEHLFVGYVEGTGDQTSDSLFPLLKGHVERVAIDHLTPDNLKRFDAVILGVRAFESHADLVAAGPALLAYAQAGGIVIVQYVARELPAGVAPYPLSLGANEKVVDESAPVAILDPTDPLLTWPNKITAADFSGWVEERGHGFMGSWDAHYKPLLESHDPGQKPQEGGLLVARTGKGAWIYLAYALYRQLPEGVPGPYRLLANLISAGKEPQAGSR